MKDKVIEAFESAQQKWQQLWKEQILQNPTVQQGSNWYNQQTSRDQLVIKSLAMLLVALLAFMLFYSPLLKEKAQTKQVLERNLQTYNLIASNAGRFSGSGVGGNSQTSILTAVTSLARSQNLNLSRYEQDGNNLRIWLDRVAFDDAITWFESLQSKHAITVSQISIDKTSSNGRVDVRATLGR